MNDIFFKVKNIRLAQDFRDSSGKFFLQINFNETTGLTLPISKKQVNILQQMLDLDMKKLVIEDRRNESDMRDKQD